MSREDGKRLPPKGYKIVLYKICATCGWSRSLGATHCKNTGYMSSRDPIAHTCAEWSVSCHYDDIYEEDGIEQR